VSALTPSAETALAVGPVVMILSLMLADTGGMFAPVPAFLRPLSHLSVRGCRVRGSLSLGTFRLHVFHRVNPPWEPWTVEA
jgi:hypothetical protein